MNEAVIDALPGKKWWGGTTTCLSCRSEQASVTLIGEDGDMLECATCGEFCCVPKLEYLLMAWVAYQEQVVQERHRLAPLIDELAKQVEINEAKNTLVGGDVELEFMIGQLDAMVNYAACLDARMATWTMRRRENA